MKLKDCVLDVDVVVSAPLVVKRPNKEWVEAREKGIIPQALFQFYGQANYFSLGAAPPFLNDEENILFPYLANLFRGIKNCLVESDKLVKEIAAYSESRYTPVKKLRGKDWDPEAKTKLLQSFKYLVVNLVNSLDLFAELVGLFLNGKIKGLNPGRCSFTKILNFMNKPLPPPATIVSPAQHQVEKLYMALHPLIVCNGSEQDWLELLYLYRNKLSHLGQYMFPQIGLHDEAGEFYTFIPRQWPFIHEQYMKPADPNAPKSHVANRKLLKEKFIHIDLIEYSEGILRKIICVLQEGLSVLCDTYQQLRDLPLNRAALDSLNENSKYYNFTEFAGGQ